VIDGVGEQIVDHLSQSLGITTDFDRVRGKDENGMPRRPDQSRLDCLPRHRRHIDRLEVKGTFLIEARQQEKIVDQDVHSIRFVSDVVHRGGEVSWPLPCSTIEHLGIAPDRGQWGTQLVSGVGQEPPQSRLGPCSFGHGCFDLAQHRIERQAESSDFGACLSRSDSPAEITQRD
jgi:hypothetical protein